eukprot:12754906-Ditylum_brightwellii.AAC.1
MLPTIPNFKGNKSIKPMTRPPNSGIVNNFLPKGQTCNASSPDKVAARPNAEALIKEMLLFICPIYLPPEWKKQK